MTPLILEPTINAEWQNLLKEAEKSSHVELNDDLESYLLFLLVRFTNRPEIAKSVLSTDFLEGMHTLGSQKNEALRDVGDKCLLFSGLFPGRAERKSVNITYFVELGQNAYAHLAEISQHTLAKLFHSINKGFVSLMEVLQAIRAFTAKEAGLTPLQAEELWSHTQSRYAYKVLKQYTGHSSIPRYNSTVRH